jgi:hypothetical protein
LSADGYRQLGSFSPFRTDFVRNYAQIFGPDGHDGSFGPRPLAIKIEPQRWQHAIFKWFIQGGQI